MITILGRTTFRNDRRLFGIKRADRRFHTYIIGKTGTGKSTLLETLIRQDMTAGEGLALLDPHGDLMERLLAGFPAHRQADLISFDVPDSAQPLGFNPLAGVPAEKRALAASGLLEVFKKLWIDSWGPRLEHILRNALLALLDQPEATLADVLELLTDEDFRRDAATRVSSSQVRKFWLREYEGYPARFRAEAIVPIQNKVGAFLTNPLLNRILTRPASNLDLRQILDERKILLVNLAKGKIGEDTAALIGALLVASLGAAAFSRADLPEASRRDFWVYLDEFHSFTTLSLATMLSELRKYRVGLVLAHQYLSQLEEPIRDAILGNVGTIVCFRVGPADAEILAKEFSPELSEVDLLRLPNHHVYLKLMVDGRPSEPFSAETLAPID
jgi:type IV secretory pathway TraG/TraD family ATPase VirD4